MQTGESRVVVGWKREGKMCGKTTHIQLLFVRLACWWFFAQFSPHFPDTHTRNTTQKPPHGLGGTRKVFQVHQHRLEKSRKICFSVKFSRTHAPSPFQHTKKLSADDREKAGKFHSSIIDLESRERFFQCQKRVLSRPFSGVGAQWEEDEDENIQAEACAAAGEKPTDKSHSVDRAENLENEENSDVFFSSLQISSRIARIAALRGFSHHISSDLKLFYVTWRLTWKRLKRKCWRLRWLLIRLLGIRVNLRVQKEEFVNVFLCKFDFSKHHPFFPSELFSPASIRVFIHY